MIPFKASTTLFRENSRLNPCKGLIRLNFGLSSSPLTRSLVWAKVAATAQMAVTSSRGSTVVTSSKIPWCSSSATWSPTGRLTPQAARHAVMNADISWMIFPDISHSAAQEPSSVVTATAS